MANLQVTQLTGARERHEMVMFPWTVYRGDKNWVPPVIKDRQKLLDPKRNPFFQQADVAEIPLGYILILLAPLSETKSVAIW